MANKQNHRVFHSGLSTVLVWFRLNMLGHALSMTTCNCREYDKLDRINKLKCQTPSVNEVLV